jgi:hypothetical protein
MYPNQEGLKKGIIVMIYLEMDVSYLISYKPSCWCSIYNLFSLYSEAGVFSVLGIRALLLYSVHVMATTYFDCSGK